MAACVTVALSVCLSRSCTGLNEMLLARCTLLWPQVRSSLLAVGRDLGLDAGSKYLHRWP